jgi:hypothetical protein
VVVRVVVAVGPDDGDGVPAGLPLGEGVVERARHDDVAVRVLVADDRHEGLELAFGEAVLRPRLDMRHGD